MERKQYTTTTATDTVGTDCSHVSHFDVWSLFFFFLVLCSMASVDKQLLGTETAHSMRCKGVKSIICGLSANDIRDSFISSGADNFLLKPMPCKAKELRETLLQIVVDTR